MKAFPEMTEIIELADKCFKTGIILNIEIGCKENYENNENNKKGPNGK